MTQHLSTLICLQAYVQGPMICFSFPTEKGILGFEGEVIVHLPVNGKQTYLEIEFRSPLIPQSADYNFTLTYKFTR